MTGFSAAQAATSCSAKAAPISSTSDSAPVKLAMHRIWFPGQQERQLRSPLATTPDRFAAGTAQPLPTDVPAAGIWVPLAGGPLDSLPGAAADGSPVALAIDSGGAGAARYVAYVADAGGTKEIYVARHDAGGWAELAGSASLGGVSNSEGLSREPAIVLVNGVPVVGWIETTAAGSEVRVARYDATANSGAGGWVLLGGDAIGPALSRGHVELALVDGAVSAFWTADMNGTTRLHAARFDGAAWTALGAGSLSGQGIGGSVPVGSDFAVAADGSSVAVAWSHVSGETASIEMRRFDGVEWSDAPSIYAGDAIAGDRVSLDPSLAYDNGALTIAWIERNDDTGRRDVLYAKQLTGTPGNESFAELFTGAAEGTGFAGTDRIAGPPRLVAANGTLGIAWTDLGLDGETPHGRIYTATLVAGTGIVPTIGFEMVGDGVLSLDGALATPSYGRDAAGREFVAALDVSHTASEIKVAGSLTATGRVFVADATTSIQSILDAEQLAEGDVILVGADVAPGDVTIGSGDDGVTLIGMPGAVIDGGLILNGTTATRVEKLTVTGTAALVNANDAVLSELTIMGSLVVDGGSGHIVIGSSLLGETGIAFEGAPTGISIIGNTIAANQIGVDVTAPTDLRLVGNTISAGLTGLRIDAAVTGAISGNTISKAATGVVYNAAAPLSGNIITGNDIGIVSSVGDTASALGFVAGSGRNVVSGNRIGVSLANGLMQGQTVSNNETGVIGSGVLGGSDLTSANLITGNAIGVAGFDGAVRFNRIIANGTGIEADLAGAAITNNVVARNTLVGISVAANDVTLDANTVYAEAGDAVLLKDFVRGTSITNSILYAVSGTALGIPETAMDEANAGFWSDYNTLYAGDDGILVSYTQDYVDILDWQADLARYDLHSVGRTVLDPRAGKPVFADLANDDYRVIGMAAGQRQTAASTIGGENGIAQGAYDTPVNLHAGASTIALTSPDLYVDWQADVVGTITWQSFGAAAGGPVRIELWQDGPNGPALLSVIAENAADTGTFDWRPEDNAIAAGTLWPQDSRQLRGSAERVRHVERNLLDARGRQRLFRGDRGAWRQQPQYRQNR